MELVFDFIGYLASSLSILVFFAVAVITLLNMPKREGIHIKLYWRLLIGFGCVLGAIALSALVYIGLDDTIIRYISHTIGIVCTVIFIILRIIK